MKKKTVAAGAGGGGKCKRGATAPTDLLGCFPARRHLALMPKAICSPSRTTIMDKAVAARRRQLQLPAARFVTGGGAGGGGGRARGSPLFRGSKSKSLTVVEDDEPQSPKVTCAGQIKVVRPRKAISTPVVEKDGNGSGGGGGNGRRDALPFFGGALRSLRLKVRCFGPLHATVDSSTDGSDDDAGEHEGESAGAGGSTAASVFSKWLMVLEGSQEPREHDDKDEKRNNIEVADDCSCSTAPPPLNALLLMRCRSAPAKRVARRGEGEEQQKGHVEEELVFMSTAPDYL